MTRAFLGVEQSLAGRRWVGPDAETERLAAALEQETREPLALCQVLARLRVEPAQVARYLAPSIRDLLPDPLTLKDMDRAAGRFVEAVQTGEKVAIFADYDVDGGASAALLIDWLRNFGIKPTLYVPDRIDEGYGPNEPAMAMLAEEHSLIICVDCGTLSHGPIAAAKDADVLVLDHHLGGETLPPALAVVNPNRQDETTDLGHLCAAAVVFLFLVETNRQIRALGRQVPDLMAALDLVGLATVADVAPLTGVNRAFVRQGLRVMGARGRAGLTALADAARLDSVPSAYHLGFVLGPRINAGGRVGQSDLGARLLASANPNEAAHIAAELERLNAERRAIEDVVREEALAQADARGLDRPLVWAAGDDWHPGVVGIVASRLKESVNRPAIVIGFDGDDGKGSGRSVPGVDLGAIIHRVASEGLIERGGGHRMAAGLSLTRTQLQPAMERIAELIAAQSVAFGGPRELRIDGALMAPAISVDLIRALEQAGPYGAAAPAPRFALPAQKISFAKEVGQGHLKLRLTGAGAALDAIAFNAFEAGFGQYVLNHDGRSFHLVGRLDINNWQGRQTPQLRLEDVAPCTD